MNIQYISYGIDLGTTNSCIANFDGEKVKVFQNNDQMNVTPSVVRIEKNGRTIVGRRAYATKLENPENVASEFKRWMGQKDRCHFQASGKSLSAEELSAEILKTLIDDVRSQTGEQIEAAVITVPAAFGQLQCEATSRAAQLAGLKESVLIQEPVAAAIAYGLSPDARDQRWLVFDLGGGTFDVAVISSKEGRLTVLDHRGDNHLGGKDIDKLIVEKLLYPELVKEFRIPSSEENPKFHQKLIQRLRLKAEEAKIDLSRADKAIVGLFELGDDLDGNSIEGEINISRSQLEKLCVPLVENCISLCEETIEGARCSRSDLDKIILVGGPTQMPFIREELRERLCTEIEHSIDPMTIVAQGAAIQAASTERKISSQIVASEVEQTKDFKAEITLAFDPISPDLQTIVEGQIKLKDNQHLSIKIDAEAGHWTSGWTETDEGSFEFLLSLLEGKSNKFWIYVRDKDGNNLETTPDSFVIRHGLSISAPILPHSISTEVIKADGTSELELLVRRASQLPIEVSKIFHANKTLAPRSGDSISIKLWEGEFFAEPEANDFVGNLLIDSNMISRSLQEGSEIEITVSIDASRRVNITAFVPRLNAHFNDNVYAPQRDEQEFSELSKQLPREIESHSKKIENLEKSLDGQDEVSEKQLDKIKNQISTLKSTLEDGSAIQTDPDSAKKLVCDSRNIRAQLSKLENRIDQDSKISSTVDQICDKLDDVEELVVDYGSPVDEREFSLLKEEFEDAKDRNDERKLKRVQENVESLYARILLNQDWFWEFSFEKLSSESRSFVNSKIATELISSGHEAVGSKDIKKLRFVVSELWKLIPKEQADLDKAMALESGIRK
ncbi:Hsp70 family protein [bacterium]|nr:Hsp70 family protein [bacterium]